MSLASRALISSRSLRVLVRKPALLASTCFMLFTGLAVAQTFAPTAPNRIPKDPDATISIPDTKTFWNELNQLPLSDEVREYLDSEEFRQSQTFGVMEAQISLLRESSGIYFWPDDFFVDTLAGVDLHLRRSEGRTYALWCLSFNQPGQVERLINQILDDAQDARGVSGGFTADTVDNRMDRGFRVYTLPAFEIFFAEASPTQLLLATNDDLLLSGLTGEGTGYLTTEFFLDHREGLPESDPDLWAIGDIGMLMNSITRMIPQEQSSIPVPEDLKGILSLEFNDLSTNLTHFTPASQMTGDERRTALAAPQPGNIDVLRFFKQDAIIVYGTNYFDGLESLEQSLDIVGDMDNAGMSRSDIESQLSQSRQILGFDIRTDLLSNIGPELGFAFHDLTIPQTSEAGQQAEIDILLAVRIKSLSRFAPVLSAIEANFSNPPRMSVSEHNGLELKTIEHPMLAPLGIAPSYGITGDNYFLLTLTREALTAAIDRGNSGSTELLESQAMATASRLLDEEVNSYTIIPGSGLERVFTATRSSIQDMAQGAVKNNQLTQLGDWLGLIDIAAGTVTYTADGKKTSILIGMKESD